MRTMKLGTPLSHSALKVMLLGAGKRGKEVIIVDLLSFEPFVSFVVKERFS